MRGMPLGQLRFCRGCLAIDQAATGAVCDRCGVEWLALLDEDGAISRDFLVARGSCCDSGCRNCPYEKGEVAGVAREKSCQRCGSGFECRSAGCWCDNVRLSPATLKWLQRTYVGCLCPSCLAEFSVA
jgi:hypothetical protein